MKLMTSLQSLIALSMGGRALQLSKTSFTGQQCLVRRSYARLSPILMMPEGPEVRTVVDQLQGGVSKRLVDIKFLSGRYVRHGRPSGFEEFAKTMSPIVSEPQMPSPEAIDMVLEWTAKGKFIYMMLDDGKIAPKNDTDFDFFARSIWITLGMTGQFVNEQIHLQDPRFARWYLEFLDVESRSTHKVYYHDRRNFGTLKFCLSKQEMDKKLKSLGPDVLSPETTVEDFLGRMESTRDGVNICKFLMDQNVRFHHIIDKHILFVFRMTTDPTERPLFSCTRTRNRTCPGRK
jgi:formamidopyrimidine-DNA glycosylase